LGGSTPSLAGLQVMLMAAALASDAGVGAGGVTSLEE
jgi:hypothetical protein